MRGASIQDWTTKFFSLDGFYEVSSYRATLVEGHVPLVFFIPKWVRKDLARTPNTQREIETMLCLRVLPQPLDLINEPNLRTYRLALVDDDNKDSRSHTIAIIPSTLAPLTSEGETLECLVPISGATIQLLLRLHLLPKVACCIFVTCLALSLYFYLIYFHLTPLSTILQ